MRGVPDRNALNSWIVSHWKNTLSYGLPGLGPRRTWGLLREVTVSLLLATVFWFAVVFGQAERLERVLSVPIEYVATPEYIALVGDKPTEVKLHLAGPRSDLNELSLSQLAVRIDLSKAEPGKQTFVVTEQDLRLPKRVKLLDARPSVLVLNFREISEKEVTVKPQLVGRLPGDLEIESVKVNPEKVLILSPGREGSKEERSVMTTPIYLETIRERTTLFCKIIAPPSLQPAAGRWPDVEVEIAVRPRKGQQSR